MYHIGESPRINGVLKVMPQNLKPNQVQMLARPPHYRDGLLQVQQNNGQTFHFKMLL